MNTIVEKALGLWGMADANYHLVAARENHVFKVTADSGSFALRLHRPNYRTDQELWSELKWMSAAALGGIKVPDPVPSISGEVLHHVEGTQVDVLNWLSGAPMASVIGKCDASDRIRLFFGVGQEMARLHEISDEWNCPSGFQRCSWDRAGLLGANPIWDRFWENPALESEDQELFNALRNAANDELARMEQTLNYGLIHADLVGANILVDDKQLQLIDFDDGGFGYRLFDIATALLKFRLEEDYPRLRAALTEGYSSVRAIDLGALDLFMVLRAATYVGWNISRMSEDQSGSRNDRFIQITRQLARKYLMNGTT